MPSPLRDFEILPQIRQMHSLKVRANEQTLLHIGAPTRVLTVAALSKRHAHRHFMPDLPEHIRSGLRKVFVEKESHATASYADA